MVIIQHRREKVISLNDCFRNLSRIEFVITYDCTGRCKHCSQGKHPFSGVHVNPKIAENVIYDLSEKYNIQSVMTFGGEPLLYADSVFAIHRAAKNVGIFKRQLITNGFFTKDEQNIKKVCEMLKICGVNDLLLSVDAFHQEKIPIEPVKLFAKNCKNFEIPIRLNPAWLVDKEHNNPYNNFTREILKIFTDSGIPESDGNVIFPEGNAGKYLKEYFDENTEYVNPYVENPKDIRSVSIEPDGKVLGTNLDGESIINILENFITQ